LRSDSSSESYSSRPKPHEFATWIKSAMRGVASFASSSSKSLCDSGSSAMRSDARLRPTSGRIVGETPVESFDLGRRGFLGLAGCYELLPDLGLVLRRAWCRRSMLGQTLQPSARAVSTRTYLKSSRSYSRFTPALIHDVAIDYQYREMNSPYSPALDPLTPEAGRDVDGNSSRSKCKLFRIFWKFLVVSAAY
jgi:hypothetical protein